MPIVPWGIILQKILSVFTTATAFSRVDYRLKVKVEISSRRFFRTRVLCRLDSQPQILSSQVYAEFPLCLEENLVVCLFCAKPLESGGMASFFVCPQNDPAFKLFRKFLE